MSDASTPDVHNGSASNGSASNGSVSNESVSNGSGENESGDNGSDILSDAERPGGHRVVFTPSGAQAIVDDGTTVLDAARQLRVDLDSVCGGRSICGRCQVRAPEGTFAKWNITADGEGLVTAPVEGRLARPLVADHVLGCSARIRGDVVIDVPAASQVHRPIVRKDLVDAGFTVDPRCDLWFVTPTMDTSPDASASAYDQIRDALLSAHEVSVGAIRPELLARLQPVIDASSNGLTVAVTPLAIGPIEASENHRSPTEIVGMWPGAVVTVYGVAIDVGSTTIAAHLVDLTSGLSLASRGMMNPQIRFGEDLMSRVSYVMMNPGGATELTDTIRSAIDELIVGLAADAEVELDRITDVVIVGNPIMHHLVLGIDPTPLGQAPFTLATAHPVATTAEALGIGLPLAQVYFGPCIAGHVGADTTAAILADGPHRGDGWRLLVDVGTNAEIVLGSPTQTFAASSPTGPAFEGAQISHGQRATTGAIDRVRIDPATGATRFGVIGVGIWSDEPTFADAVDPANGGPGITGICGSGIIDVIAEMYLAGYLDTDGTIVDRLSPTGEPADPEQRIVDDGRTKSFVLSHEPRIVVTQNDVRAVQLAKAALRAGIELLIDRAGSPTIESIALAGAFGAHIDPLRAMVLGLIPDAPIEAVRSVGNAAGAGAVAALVSMEARTEMESVAASVVKVETATEPSFQQRFVDAMALPHASAPVDHINTLVDLPTPRPAAAAHKRGRRDRPRRRTSQGAI